MDVPGNEEESPPPKRLRRTACHCLACNGAERDYRTISKHLGDRATEEGEGDEQNPSTSYAVTTIQEPAVTNAQVGPAVTTIQEEPDDQLHSSEPKQHEIVLTPDKVDRFVCKQIHHKLVNGYSKHISNSKCRTYQIYLEKALFQSAGLR